ncbi:MAG: hypothetical protein ACREJC_12385, partial [Tepidisphaeraceae bacterium]
PWQYMVDGPGVLASLFDAGGMFIYNGVGSDYIPNTDADIPGASYSTRISSNLSWINGVIGAGATFSTPEPAGALATIFGILGLMSRRPRSRQG